MDALAVLYRRPGPWWLVLLCGLASHAARTAEADRERAALLAAVSHDLRTPLAAAKAAISGLRSPHARLSAGDRDELLASAEESLDQLTWLAASLLDVSRLQAGAHAIFRARGRRRPAQPCPGTAVPARKELPCPRKATRWFRRARRPI